VLQQHPADAVEYQPNKRQKSDRIWLFVRLSNPQRRVDSPENLLVSADVLPENIFCLLYNLKFLASQLLSSSSAFTLISCSAYSILKMKAIYSCEMSVDFKQTTWRYMPEVITLHNHRSEDIKSYIVHYIVSEVK
jgi:hypothetical protein